MSKHCFFHNSLQCHISLSFSIPEFYSVVLFTHYLYHPRLMNFNFFIIFEGPLPTPALFSSQMNIVKLTFLYGKSNIVQQICVLNKNISKYQYNIMMYPLLIIKVIYVFFLTNPTPIYLLISGTGRNNLKCYYDFPYEKCFYLRFFVFVFFYHVYYSAHSHYLNFCLFLDLGHGIINTNPSFYICCLQLTSFSDLIFIR